MAIELETHEAAEAWISKAPVGSELKLFFQEGSINNQQYTIAGVVESVLVIRHETKRLGWVYECKDQFWLFTFAEHLTLLEK